MTITQRIDAAYEYIRQHVSMSPEIGIILGSGLGDYAETLENQVVIPYTDIPNFPVSTVAGHVGAFVFGTHNGKAVVCMRGRIHYYEGYTQQELSIPVRVMHKLGVKTLIITNAVGGVNTFLKLGDFVLISDHINMSGYNPLIGRNYNDFGPRFPDMGDVYTKRLRTRIKNVADEQGIDLKEGVYLMYSGPSYETPAEIRAFRNMGADVVGMSCVPEAIVARHCGMRVAAISCVTNMAAGVLDEELNHNEVLATAGRVRGEFARLLNLIVSIVQPLVVQ